MAIRTRNYSRYGKIDRNLHKICVICKTCHSCIKIYGIMCKWQARQEEWENEKYTDNEYYSDDKKFAF